MTDDAATRFLHEAMPLCATLGVRAVSSTPDAVVLSLDWKPELCTSNGLLHGGVIMALADSAGGACAFENLPDGATGTSTIESKTNFLGAVHARLRHRNRDRPAPRFDHDRHRNLRP